jgi:hypothetical protein
MFVYARKHATALLPFVAAIFERRRSAAAADFVCALYATPRDSERCNFSLNISSAEYFSAI